MSGSSNGVVASADGAPRDVGAPRGAGAPRDVAPPRERHEARRDVLRAEALSLTARSDRISTLRGVTFLIGLGGVLVVAFAHLAREAWIPVAVVGAVFAALVVHHALLVTRGDGVTRRLRLIEASLLRIDGAWDELGDGGSRFLRGDHPYAGDLDVFGVGSLYQSLSTAHTARGEQVLADWLLTPASPAVVHARQAAARELATAGHFREELELAAARAKTSGMAQDPLAAWALDRPEGRPLHELALLNLGRALVVLTLGGFTMTQIVAPATLGPLRFAWILTLLLQLGLLALLRGRVASPLSLLAARDAPFSAYLALVRLVEGQRFQAPLLADAQRALAGASRELARLARILSWAELRHNALAHVVINPILLWDVFAAAALERWRTEVGPRVEAWIEALAEVEALAAFAAFADDHPELTFPELEDGPPAFRAEALGHPLLKRARRVDNDVAMGGVERTRALLVTGSNMSGKSTLLRAIGVNAVLAQAGAPCGARHLSMTPLAVHTSMRVSDSLREGVSHFYAELARLKSVVDAADRGERVLFLLDEVLHGTNSRERQVGAKAVALHLCTAGAIGALSSHDLGLADLAEESGGRVACVHFEEQVDEGKMTFDYRLKPGVVTSGNALRLMRDLGLPVPADE